MVTFSSPTGKHHETETKTPVARTARTALTRKHCRLDDYSTNWTETWCFTLRIGWLVYQIFDSVIFKINQHLRLMDIGKLEDLPARNL